MRKMDCSITWCTRKWVMTATPTTFKKTDNNIINNSNNKNRQQQQQQQQQHRLTTNHLYFLCSLMPHCSTAHDSEGISIFFLVHDCRVWYPWTKTLLCCHFVLFLQSPGSCPTWKIDEAYNVNRRHTRSCSLLNHFPNSSRLPSRYFSLRFLFGLFFIIRSPTHLTE